MPAKLTLEEFIRKARLIHGDAYDYSFVVYINCNTKVKIWCKKCKKFFEQTPSSHLSGRRCPYCFGTPRKNLEQFIIEANIVHNNFYTYEHFIYVNNNTKSWITCPIHGDFEQRPKDHLRGNGCPHCAGLIKLTLEEFIKRAQLVHGDKYDYSKVVYVNITTLILIKCNKCGQWFKQRPQHHLNGHGCPFCCESFGEKNISKYLTEHNIEFEREKRFKDCRDKMPLSFDFYLPNLNACIEYDGEQHFEPIDFFGGENGLSELKKRDKIKTDYCLKNHIRIIRIKFYEDIDKILDLYLKTIFDE